MTTSALFHATRFQYPPTSHSLPKEFYKLLLCQPPIQNLTLLRFDSIHLETPLSNVEPERLSIHDGPPFLTSRDTSALHKMPSGSEGTQMCMITAGWAFEHHVCRVDRSIRFFICRTNRQLSSDYT